MLLHWLLLISVNITCLPSLRMTKSWPLNPVLDHRVVSELSLSLSSDSAPSMKGGVVKRLDLPHLREVGRLLGVGIDAPGEVKAGAESARVRALGDLRAFPVINTRGRDLTLVRRRRGVVAVPIIRAELLFCFLLAASLYYVSLLNRRVHIQLPWSRSGCYPYRFVFFCFVVLF